MGLMELASPQGQMKAKCKAKNRLQASHMRSWRRDGQKMLPYADHPMNPTK